ncbi:MAG: FadR family transcriptional regulator [Alphaproteobacteria bacterium]|nr:FadR family transcriptional regulator [Alphaproteobacteria bacterium]
MNESTPPAASIGSAPAPEADIANVVRSLRSFIAETARTKPGRLPPERSLSESLGVSRAQLRKALAALEHEGQLWRHVGKGTFVGPRPPELIDVPELARRTTPMQVMRARFAVEPELASLAALNATASEIGELQEFARGCRAARTWREYEAFDARFHHAIANAAHNLVLLALLDTLNSVRRAVTWGRPRPEGDSPPPTHHSFADHDRIVEAIALREPANAAAAMRAHLQRVEDRLVGRSA